MRSRTPRMSRFALSALLALTTLPLGPISSVSATASLGETDNDIFVSPGDETGAWVTRNTFAVVRWNAPEVARFAVERLDDNEGAYYALRPAVEDASIETRDAAVLSCRKLGPLDLTRPEVNPTCFLASNLIDFVPVRSELDVMYAPLTAEGCPENGYALQRTIRIKRAATLERRVKLSGSLTCYRFAVRFYDRGGNWVDGDASGIYVTSGDPRRRSETAAAPDPVFVFPALDVSGADIEALRNEETGEIPLKWAIEEAPPAFLGDDDAGLRAASITTYYRPSPQTSEIDPCPAPGGPGWLMGSTESVTADSSLLPAEDFDAIITGASAEGSTGETTVPADGRCRYLALTVSDEHGRVGAATSGSFMVPLPRPEATPDPTPASTEIPLRAIPTPSPSPVRPPAASTSPRAGGTPGSVPVAAMHFTCEDTTLRTAPRSSASGSSIETGTNLYVLSKVWGEAYGNEHCYSGKSNWWAKITKVGSTSYANAPKYLPYAALVRGTSCLSDIGKLLVENTGVIIDGGDTRWKVSGTATRCKGDLISSHYEYWDGSKWQRDTVAGYAGTSTSTVASGKASAITFGGARTLTLDLDPQMCYRFVARLFAASYDNAPFQTRYSSRFTFLPSKSAECATHPG